jgi:protein involved in polysaccharide export with SLBB domain
MISDFVIKTALKNAIVNVTLLDIRRFKIQVLGAVYDPGFIEMTPIDKVYDAILQAGGVQKYAHSDTVRIIRSENTISVKLKEYLSGNDISQNILLKEGDVIYVPFKNNANLTNFKYTTYNKNQVIIYGFVHRGSRGNSFKYYPGYTARDYVALAGGTKEAGSIFRMGNINKITIYRSDGEKIKNAIDEIVFPGDVIEVPPNLLYQIVGRDGTIRTLASIVSSVYTAYIIYKFAQE